MQCFESFIRNSFLGRFTDFLIHLGCLGRFMCEVCIGAHALRITSQGTELVLGKLGAKETCKGGFSSVYFSSWGDHGSAQLRRTHGQKFGEKLPARVAKWQGNQDGERPLPMRECHDAQGHVGWPLARC